MRTLKIYLPAAAAVVVFSLAVAISNVGQVVAQAVRDVVVINTTAQPVPTTAQGITSIAGTVQAEQGGSWNVGITGTPTVQVANPASAPLLTRDVDRPATQPFLHACTASGAGPNVLSGTSVADLVPAGKRLVIEYVSAAATALPGQVVLVKIKITRPPISGVPVSFDHHLVATPQGTFLTDAVFVVSQPVRMYADPATDLRLECEVAQDSLSGDLTLNMTISGHLVDVSS